MDGARRGWGDGQGGDIEASKHDVAPGVSPVRALEDTLLGADVDNTRRRGIYGDTQSLVGKAAGIRPGDAAVGALQQPGSYYIERRRSARVDGEGANRGPLAGGRRRPACAAVRALEEPAVGRGGIDRSRSRRGDDDVRHVPALGADRRPREMACFGHANSEPGDQKGQPQRHDDYPDVRRLPSARTRRIVHDDLPPGIWSARQSSPESPRHTLCGTAVRNLHPARRQTTPRAFTITALADRLGNPVSNSSSKYCFSGTSCGYIRNIGSAP